MASIEGRGKNVEEAILDALGRTGLKRADVNIAVISEGKSKILGLLGGEEAVVEISPKKLAGQPAPNGADEVIMGVMEDLFRLAGLDVVVDTFDDDGTIKLEVSGSDAAIVIGRYGDTLSAFQTIVRAITSRKFVDRFPVSIDVEGYIERQDRKLRDFAIRMAKEAQYNGRPVTLDPMSARERRVVHLSLSTMKGVSTESQGEGVDRHIIITAQGERQKFARSGNHRS